jgi:hypothetical protein
VLTDLSPTVPQLSAEDRVLRGPAPFFKSWLSRTGGVVGLADAIAFGLRHRRTIQQLSTLNSQLSTLNSQLSTLNSQLSTLNSQLSAWLSPEP